VEFSLKIVHGTSFVENVRGKLFTAVTDPPGQEHHTSQMRVWAERDANDDSEATSTQRHDSDTES
jgi:hypothetical protein